MNAFKVGDVVQLKSGGPLMTIAEVRGDEQCRCSWFLNGKRFQEMFNKDELEKVENETDIGEV